MLIFTYGTLKEGFPNFGVNRGQRVPGEFRTLLALPLLLVTERHTPWLLWQPGQGFRVRGQLFDVDVEALAAMDQLEGVDDADGYRRVRLLVQDASGDEQPPIAAEAYIKPPAQLRGQPLQSGPHPEYTLELAALYRKRSATRG